MIVKNGEASLEACLQSLEGLAPVYLTDTGSQDRTCDIAQSHRAHLRHFPWTHDFAAARNASIAHIAESWILILDADDAFPPGEFRRLLRLLDPAAAAASLQYRLRPDYSPWAATRLFRNDPLLRFQGRIHEHPTDWLENQRRAGAPFQALDVALHHHGYFPEAMPAKVARNLPLLQAEWDHPHSPASLSRRCEIGAELGITLAQAGHLAEAATFLDALLPDGLSAPPPALPAILRALVCHIWVLQQVRGPGPALQSAQRLQPLLQPLAAYALHRGLAEIAAQRLPQARPWLEHFARRTHPPEIPVPAPFLAAELPRLLGSCCLAQADLPAAHRYFSEALALDPANPDLLARLRFASPRP